MPLIAQICMVVVTIALAGAAVMVVRLMHQTKGLIETANRSLVELPALIAEAKRGAERVEALLDAFSQITQAARSSVSRVEHVVTQSTTLASTLLDELESPVSRAAGVIRGIRFGVHHLKERRKSRAEGRSHNNQGDDHVGAQRWLDDGGIPAGSGGRGRSGADLRADDR